MGGLSPEREVSLASGSAVLEAVKRKGLSGVGIDVSNDIAFALEKNKVDITSKEQILFLINNKHDPRIGYPIKLIDLVNNTNINNIFIKKISDNKYRLLAGPFKNFNALKTIYISLNNLGFRDLNIFRE